MSKEPFSSFGFCAGCDRYRKVEYYTKLKQTPMRWMGMKGTSSTSFCPFCGYKSSGFRADSDEEWDKMSYMGQRIADFDEDDESDDYEKPWWEDDDDDDGEMVEFDLEMDPEEITERFTCPSCSKTFRINTQGCERIFCYYCGEVVRG